MTRKTGSGAFLTRIPLVAGATLLVLSACAPGAAPQGQGENRQGPAAGERQGLSLATPMGGGDYQRHLRNRDNAARSGIPFSVPPEHSRAQRPESAPTSRQGAPLSAPMHPQAGAARETEPAAVDRPLANDGQRENLRETTLADQQLFDPENTREAATRRPAPASASGEGTQTSVPLVRVTDASADDGPNVIAYALNTNHPVGTERYPRRNPLRWQVWERNCLQYGNQNAAQEAFLAAGGPERDRHNLDPVGDGYACWWDPEPIRQAVDGG